MIHDTQYWLAEMERLEHAWSIGGRWAILSHAMSAAIAEEQAPATHEALLASARGAVGRDLERAGWRGVMAYVGEALDRLRDILVAACVANNALDVIYWNNLCPFNRCQTEFMGTPCALCPHAEWPDSPVAAQTDPETHNPALETQTANTSESGAMDSEDVRVSRLVEHGIHTAQELANAKDEITSLNEQVDYWWAKWAGEKNRADKVSARWDRWRRRCEAAEKLIERMVGDNVRTQPEMARLRARIADLEGK